MWKLYKFVDLQKVFVDDFHSPEGRECWAYDMYNWMEEKGYYEGYDQNDFKYCGDSDYVDIMGKKENMPDFRFEWEEEE